MTSYWTTLRKDLWRAIGCYILGVTAAALLVSIPMLIYPLPFVLFFGLMIGLPALLVILVSLATCQRSIHAHLTTWCILFPFLTVLISVPAIQVIFFGGPSNPARYWSTLASGEFWLIFLLVFGAAVLSSRTFHHQTREAERTSSDETLDKSFRQLEVQP